MKYAEIPRTVMSVIISLPLFSEVFGFLLQNKNLKTTINNKFTRIGIVQAGLLSVILDSDSEKFKIKKSRTNP